MKRRSRAIAICAATLVTSMLLAISACVIDLDPPLTGAADASPDALDASVTDGTSLTDVASGDGAIDASDAGSAECVDPTDCPAPSGAAAGCVSTACTNGRCVYDLCGASTAAACNASACTTDDGGRCAAPAPTSYVSYVNFPRVNDVVFASLPCATIANCSTVVYPYFFYADVNPVDATYTINAYSIAVPELTPTPVAVGINFKPNQVLRSGNRVWVVGVVNAGAVEIAWFDLPRIPTDLSFHPSQQAVYLPTGAVQPVGYAAPGSQIFLAMSSGAQIAIFTDATITSSTSPLQFFSGGTTIVASSNSSAVYFAFNTNMGKFSHQSNVGTSSAGLVVAGPEETTAQARFTVASVPLLAMAAGDNGALGFAAPFGAAVIVDGGATYPLTTEVRFGWLLEGVNGESINATTVQAVAFDGGLPTGDRFLGSGSTAIAGDDNAFVLALDPPLATFDLALIDHADGGLTTRSAFGASFSASSYAAAPFGAAQLARAGLFSSQGLVYMIGAENAGDGGTPDIVIYPLAPSCPLDAGM